MFKFYLWSYLIFDQLYKFSFVLHGEESVPGAPGCYWRELVDPG